MALIADMMAPSLACAGEGHTLSHHAAYDLQHSGSEQYTSARHSRDLIGTARDSENIGYCARVDHVRGVDRVLHVRVENSKAESCLPLIRIGELVLSSAVIAANILERSVGELLAIQSSACPITLSRLVGLGSVCNTAGSVTK